MGTILSFCRCPFCSVMAASSSSLEVTGRVSRAGSFTTGPDGEIGGTGTDPALQLFMYAKRGLTEDVAGITAAEGLDAATLASSWPPVATGISSTKMKSLPSVSLQATLLP